MSKSYIKPSYSKGALVLFIIFCLPACSRSYSHVDVVSYDKGTIEKKTIFWGNNNNVDHILTEYRQSAIPPEAKNIFGKSQVQYYKKSTPICNNGDTLYLQECDIYRSFTSKGIKTINKGYIYVKAGKIIASKMINAQDNVIEDLAIMDEKGHIQKVFSNHARGEYFNELVIYKDEDVIQKKPIHIPLESTVFQLKRIE